MNETADDPGGLALGIRVKSGRAIVVAVAGFRAAPTAGLRREVALCDPAHSLDAAALASG